ncbi:large ribosomal subunit protein mL52 isoform 1-T1 [Sarcoramphus papa]
MASGAGLRPQHGRVRTPARPPRLVLRGRPPCPTVEGAAPPAAGGRGLRAPCREAEPGPGCSRRAGGARGGAQPRPAPQGLPAPASTDQYGPVRTLRPASGQTTGSCGAGERPPGCLGVPRPPPRCLGPLQRPFFFC